MIEILTIFLLISCIEVANHHRSPQLAQRDELIPSFYKCRLSNTMFDNKFAQMMIYIKGETFTYSFLSRQNTTSWRVEKLEIFRCYRGRTKDNLIDFYLSIFEIALWPESTIRESSLIYPKKIHYLVIAFFLQLAHQPLFCYIFFNFSIRLKLFVHFTPHKWIETATIEETLSNWSAVLDIGLFLEEFDILKHEICDVSLLRTRWMRRCKWVWWIV